jgi:hypothetical protein
LLFWEEAGFAEGRLGMETRGAEEPAEDWEEVDEAVPLGPTGAEILGAFALLLPST